METFFTQLIELTTTASRVAERVDVDRTVHIIERSGESYVGFGDFDGSNLSRVGIGFTTFVLPAGKELWAASYNSSSTSELEVIVTSIGR